MSYIVASKYYILDAKDWKYWLVSSLAGGPFCCYSFGQEDYVPELREIGLDPAVQGVPFKKKLSVVVSAKINLLVLNTWTEPV